MKILVCGDGAYALDIIEYLARIGFEVIVVSQNEKIMHESRNMIDVQFINGSPCSANTLMLAGTKLTAGIVACDSLDEKNIVICQIASSLFDITRKVALLQSREYYEAPFTACLSQDHIPITHPISIANIFVKQIINHIKYPDLNYLIELYGNIRVISFILAGNSIFLKKSIEELEDLIPNIFCIGIVHNNKYYSRNRKIIFSEYDTLIALTLSELKPILTSLNFTSNIKAVIIASETSEIANLVHQSTNISVKAICNKAPENSSECDIIVGNCTDPSFIRSMEIFEDCDYSIFMAHKSLTSNLIASLLFKHNGYSNCIATLWDNDYQAIANRLRIKSINPKPIIFGNIFKGLDHIIPIKNMYRIAEQCNIGTIEFNNKCEQFVGFNISQAAPLKLLESIIAIIRPKEIIIKPAQDTVLHLNDAMIFTVSDSNLKRFIKSFTNYI